MTFKEVRESCNVLFKFAQASERFWDLLMTVTFLSSLQRLRLLRYCAPKGLTRKVGQGQTGLGPSKSRDSNLQTKHHEINKNCFREKLYKVKKVKVGAVVATQRQSAFLTTERSWVQNLRGIGLFLSPLSSQQCILNSCPPRRRSTIDFPIK